MVNIRIIDNSFGKGKAEVVMLDKLPKLDDNADLLERLTNATEEKFKSGEINAKTYEGTTGGRKVEGSGSNRRGDPEFTESQVIARELKKYDDAIKAADQLSLAARAAAICDLRA